MTSHPKVKTVQELAGLKKELGTQNKKVVYCHGCFDLLHIGHIRYFEQAKTHGDVLFVTLTPDRYVDKGPYRPAFTEELRLEAIASLDCVDYVAINQWPTAVETLRLIRPDFYAKGAEFKDVDSDPAGKMALEAQVAEEVGATLVFTEDIVFSSTHLINRHLSNFPHEIQEYLNLFRHRHSLDQVVSALEKMARLKVLVVGDTILDEYQYCEAIGKSSKEPILVVKYLSEDMFAGGILAVANHAAGFCDNVGLLSVLGERNRNEDFILSKLSSGVAPRFFTHPLSTTIIKRRLIDGYSLNKICEIYVVDDRELPSDVEDEMRAWLKKNLPDYDLVVVADYGHGAVTPKILETLVKHAPFLAVNTQANAGNRGFHTISRYPRADFICLADPEVRLETRTMSGELEPLIREVARRIPNKLMLATQGKKGCMLLSDTGEFCQVPAFAYKVVDRVGAGDALFTVASMAAFLNIPLELIGFLGNAMGALAVEIVGNQKSVDKMSLQKYITAMLK